MSQDLANLLAVASCSASAIRSAPPSDGDADALLRVVAADREAAMQRAGQAEERCRAALQACEVLRFEKQEAQRAERLRNMEAATLVREKNELRAQLAVKTTEYDKLMAMYLNDHAQYEAARTSHQSDVARLHTALEEKDHKLLELVACSDATALDRPKTSEDKLSSALIAADTNVETLLAERSDLIRDVTRLEHELVVARRGNEQKALVHSPAASLAAALGRTETERDTACGEVRRLRQELLAATLEHGQRTARVTPAIARHAPVTTTRASQTTPSRVDSPPRHGLLAEQGVLRAREQHEGNAAELSELHTTVGSQAATIALLRVQLAEAAARDDLATSARDRAPCSPATVPAPQPAGVERRRADDAERRVTQLENTQAAAAKQVELHLAEAHGLRDANHALREACDASQAEVASLRTIHAGFQRELSASQTSIALARGERDRAVDRLNALEVERVAACEAAQGAIEHAAALKSELSASQGECFALTCRCFELEADMLRLDAFASSCNGDSGSAANTLMRMQLALDELGRTSSEERRGRLAAEQQHAKWCSIFGHVCDDPDELLEQAMAVKRRDEEHVVELSREAGAVHQLRSALHDAEAEAAELREQLAAVSPHEADFLAAQRQPILAYVVDTIRELKAPLRILAHLSAHAADEESRARLASAKDAVAQVRRAADHIAMKCFTSHERAEYALLLEQADFSRSASTIERSASRRDPVP